MGKMLQVRNVPDEVHRTLKARAATAGKSLSEYVLAELKILAQRPTMEQMMARLRSLSPVRTKLTAAEMVRQERDAR